MSDYSFTPSEIKILTKYGSLHPGNIKNLCVYWPLYLENEVSNVNIYNFYLLLNPNQRKYEKIHFQGYVSPTKKKLVKAKHKTNKRFLYLVLVINNPNTEQAHANGLLYDTQTQILERFEPHGHGTKLEYIKLKSTDTRLIKQYLQKRLDISIKRFNQPKSACPKRGWQLRQGIPRIPNENFNRQWNIQGYCAAWTLYFIILRAMNPEISSKQLQLNAFKNHEHTSSSIHEFHYSFLRWKVGFLKKQKKL